MAIEQRQVSRDAEGPQRVSREFQEVEGEAEAEAMSDAFLKSMGNQPAQQAQRLQRAGSGMRSAVVSRLQAAQGNRFVQRLVGSPGESGRLVGLSQEEMVSEVQQRKSGGAPMPSQDRGTMEGFFGGDLGEVKVHNDTTSHSLSRELDAKAFTVGSDIFMGEGAYSPGTQSGQALLAHELTHVQQQTGIASGDGVQREPAAEEEDQLQALSLQREPAAEEEDQLQALSLQREPAAEEEDQLQALSLQREPAAEEEDQLQALSLQREEASQEEDQESA
ncbi:MAG: DUF4157 domain-containing protein [Myxococcota bacterium]